MERIDIKSTSEIGTKRFYLDFKHEYKCPVCGTLCTLDLSHDYLSYPSLNTKETVGIYCDKCGDCFEKEIILRISIDVI